MRRTSGPRTRQLPPEMTLGPLETEVMAVMWSETECSVREVKQRLPHALAYTTVLTTLVRLFKKRILKRRKVERSFLYSARLSSERWAKAAASQALCRFLETPNASHELLAACIADELSQRDKRLQAVVTRALVQARR